MLSDYVIVGAGSAGCAIAARLAEAGQTVALLEAGRRDLNPLIHIPAGVAKLVYAAGDNWLYTSEPEESSGNRRLHTPRGKVLGGSSSINGMLYVRGNPADFDGWAQAGCRGWSFDEVLPLFRRSETYLQGGDPAYRGTSGPLKVEDYRTVLPLTHMFVKAAQEAGFAYTPDINGAQQEGVGYSQMTRKGRFRGSTYRTYITGLPAETRQRIEVFSNALATELLFEARRCTGVAFRRGGIAQVIKARREVILSAGAINSPQLLHLSGIGDPAHLERIGVAVRHALPGVGQNLSDHYVVRLVARLRDVVTLNQLSRFPRLATELVKFVTTGTGALTMGVTSSSVFCNSRPDLASPDLQLLFTPASYVFGKALILDRAPGMTVAICPTRPRSRGTVLARSRDPGDAPVIRNNFLSDPDDLRVMRAGFDQARRIFAARAFAGHYVSELRPGAVVTDDAAFAEFVRTEGSTLFHPVGTCRMGLDPGAVVGPDLRVHGLDGLRVADASVMPWLTTGNTNAPTIMIGEKCADLVLAARKGT